MVKCGVDTVALADSLNEGECFLRKKIPGIASSSKLSLTKMTAGVSAALIENFAVWFASSESTFVSGRIVEASWDVEDMKRHANAIAADPTMFSIGYLGNPRAA